MKDALNKNENPVRGSQASKEKRVFHSQSLFENDREIIIVHGQSQYRLQITKAGKLILNK